MAWKRFLRRRAWDEERARELETYLQVETEENIGKILVLDVETGDYAIDAKGLVANRLLRERHPEARSETLYAFRIGYDAVYAIDNTITRTVNR